MPTFAITDFNIVCSVLGGFVTLFGLVSYLFKEKFYLSEACRCSKDQQDSPGLTLYSDFVASRSYILPACYELYRPAELC